MGRVGEDRDGVCRYILVLAMGPAYIAATEETEGQGMSSLYGPVQDERAEVVTVPGKLAPHFTIVMGPTSSCRDASNSTLVPATISNKEAVLQDHKPGMSPPTTFPYHARAP